METVNNAISWENFGPLLPSVENMNLRVTPIGVKMRQKKNRFNGHNLFLAFENISNNCVLAL